MFKCNNISKEKNGRIICEKMTFQLNVGESLGIRCDSEDVLELANIFSQEEEPTSGVIETSGMKPYLLFPDEQVYEHQKTKEYLKLFADIIGTKFDEKILKQEFSLNDIWSSKLDTLSEEQHYRIRLARLYLSNFSVIISVYPRRNIEISGTHLIEKAYNFLQENGVVIIYISRYFEELAPFTQNIYSLKARKLTKMDLDGDKTEPSNNEEQFQNKELFKIQCRLKDKIILFKPDEIEYIESTDGITYVAVDNEMFKVDVTLTELEERLSPYGFFRCHRSYLVNLQQIKEIITISKNTYVIQINDSEHNEIPLSRAKIQELKSILSFK